MIFFPLIVTL